AAHDCNILLKDEILTDNKIGSIENYTLKNIELLYRCMTTDSMAAWPFYLFIQQTLPNNSNVLSCIRFISDAENYMAKQNQQRLGVQLIHRFLDETSLYYLPMEVFDNDNDRRQNLISEIKLYDNKHAALWQTLLKITRVDDSEILEDLKLILPNVNFDTLNEEVLVHFNSVQTNQIAHKVLEACDAELQLTVKVEQYNTIEKQVNTDETCDLKVTGKTVLLKGKSDEFKSLCSIFNWDDYVTKFEQFNEIHQASFTDNPLEHLSKVQSVTNAGLNEFHNLAKSKTQWKNVDKFVEHVMKSASDQIYPNGNHIEQLIAHIINESVNEFENHSGSLVLNRPKYNKTPTFDVQTEPIVDFGVIDDDIAMHQKTQKLDNFRVKFDDYEFPPSSPTEYNFSGDTSDIKRSNNQNSIGRIESTMDNSNIIRLESDVLATIFQDEKNKDKIVEQKDNKALERILAIDLEPGIRSSYILKESTLAREEETFDIHQFLSDSRATTEHSNDSLSMKLDDKTEYYFIKNKTKPRSSEIERYHNVLSNDIHVNIEKKSFIYETKTSETSVPCLSDEYLLSDEQRWTHWLIDSERSSTISDKFYKYLKANQLQSVNYFSVHEQYHVTPLLFGRIGSMIVNDVGIGCVKLNVKNTNLFLSLTTMQQTYDQLKLILDRDHLIKVYVGKSIEFLNGKVTAYTIVPTTNTLCLSFKSLYMPKRQLEQSKSTCYDLNVKQLYEEDIGIKHDPIVDVCFSDMKNDNKLVGYVKNGRQDKSNDANFAFVKKRPTYLGEQERNELLDFIDAEIQSSKWPVKEYIGIKGHRAWRALKLAADISDWGK
ncbi:unnamed protein product, partial [Didymodactylos carnosus]